jgi:hypothetical protein
MASAMYNNARQEFLNATFDMNAANKIKVRAVADEDYTYAATHTAMTSVTKYSGSTDATLASPTITDGVFDAADLSPAFTALAVDGTKDIDALVIFQYNTGDADSIPILYIDLGTAVRPNGGDINITWDSGANKIFAFNNA